VHDLTVSVADILGRPGHHRDVDIASRLEGVGTVLARLGDQPLEGRLRAESVVEGVLITGNLEGAAVVRCARCLKEFESGVALDLCELFVAPGRLPDEDAYEISGTDVELEPMLRDAATLALPLNPVCRPDCRGLCARCGQDLNAGTCDCVDDDVDPRWAALTMIKDRLEA
jgi:uncharacterized protein